MLVVAAVILSDSKVLLARHREGHHHAGLWEFPGGKVEEGETPEEALAREIFEELEVVVRVGERLAVASLEDIEMWAFAATILKGSPRATEHEEIDWVDRAELASREMPELDRQVRRNL